MKLHPQCLAERRKRRASIDPTVQRTGGEKTRRVDLGLALLSVLVKPGAGLCQEDIAIWCGCSRTAIYLLEKRVMKKVRNSFLFGRARAAGKELTT